LGAFEDGIEGRAPLNTEATMGKSRNNRIVYVGIDVSKDKLDVSWLGLDGAVQAFQVDNDDAGHEALVSHFSSRRIREVHAVFEATGPYSTALARFLCAQPERVKAMMVQPAAARQFARANMRRAKTDRVDAATLREFAERMEFVPTTLPPQWVSSVRALERHMCELVDRAAALKNQRHAIEAAGESHPAILRLIERELDNIESLVAEVETTIPGIKDRSVARLLPELLALPAHLTPREVVAYIGLDPRPRQSGMIGHHQSWAISKQGNSRVRRSLYLVALTAVRHFPPARAIYDRLRARGKLKKVAIVAVMRKLLTALWVMIARDQDFDASKFTMPLQSVAA
jgi:transposase